MDAPHDELALIPWPASLRVRPGEWRARPDSRAIVHPGLAEDSRAVVQRHADARGWSLADDEPRAGDVVWRPRDPAPDAAPAAADPAFADESHRLWVEDGVRHVEASSAVGFARAAATLAQLGDHHPAIEIEDRPRFPWRGLLLDCSRHFVPVDRIHVILEQLAAHKMNRFHWHLTDDQGWRLAIETLPRLAEVAAWRRQGDGVHGGSYGPEEVEGVLAHAHRLGISVVPEIELPGHSTAALAAYPELSCTGGPFEVETAWGIFEEVYCAGNDDTLRFLERVLDQVVQQFPGPFVHLGGDECLKTRWRSCPRCQQRIAAEGLRDEDQLQSWFVDHFGRFLAERGRRFVGWDEILEGGLPEGAIVQSWQGIEGAIAAARAGHDTIVSPMSHCYLDFNLAHLDLRRAYDFDPVPAALDERQRRHVLGGECNLWTERAPPDKLEERLFPRMLATAERLWSGPDLGYEHFLARLDGVQARLVAGGLRFGEREDPGYSADDRFDWSLPA